jgi:hypothetical protein
MEAQVEVEETMVEAVESEVTGGLEGTVAGEDLAAVRELALRAHPDAVVEMVGGGSVAEILASVEPARAAYRRVVEAEATARAATAQGAAESPGVPQVPAGGAPPMALDPDLLPPGEKIRRGLTGRA